MAIVLADLNAIIQARQEGEDNRIRQHTFDKRNTTLHLQPEEVLDNCARMVDMRMESEHICGLQTI